MQTLQRGYKGAMLIVQINADRLMAIGVLIAALYVGAYLGSH